MGQKASTKVYLTSPVPAGRKKERNAASHVSVDLRAQRLEAFSEQSTH